MKNKEILSYHTLHNHTCNLPNCSRTFLASMLSPNEHSQRRVSFFMLHLWMDGHIIFNYPIISSISLWLWLHLHISCMLLINCSFITSEHWRSIWFSYCWGCSISYNIDRLWWQLCISEGSPSSYKAYILKHKGAPQFYYYYRYYFVVIIFIIIFNFVVILLWQ